MGSLSRFIVGTAQFGLKYGVTNSQGKTSTEEVHRILQHARQSGIRFLDTADAYGDSQDVLGQAVVSDFEILSKFVSDGIALSVKLKSTLAKLRIPRLWSYSFHSFQDYRRFDDWSTVLHLKEQGLIRYMGVSVYSNEEFKVVLNDPHVDLIQLPFNLLDNEGQRGELLAEGIAKNKILHARSIFLQGLLLSEPETIPQHLRSLVGPVEQVRRIAAENSVTMAELCLGYALHFQALSGIVLGQENQTQFNENVKLFESARCTPDMVAQIGRIKVEHVDMLYPYNWNAKQ